MPEGTFVTICGFAKYKGAEPFTIGSRFMCRKDPANPYDDEAIIVMDDNGATLGYLANASGARAGGTMSSSRLYDRVGKLFVIEVWFTTRTKIICKVVDFDSMAH